MKPFVVSKIIDDSGNVIKQFEPTVQRKVISQETSDFMRKALESVVSTGTAKAGLIEGYSIGGEQAKKIGSDYIVVGRPITQAEDPVAAYRRCMAEFVD